MSPIMNSDMVVKANKVVEASYRLSLNEQRLLLMCIRQVRKDQVITPQDKFIISATEFSEIYNIPSKRVYAELQEVSARLHDRVITIANPDPEDPSIAYTRTHWISSIDYKPQKGQLILRFAYRVIPYSALIKLILRTQLATTANPHCLLTAAGSTTVSSSSWLSIKIVSQEGWEKRDLEDEIEENTNPSKHTEGAQSREISGWAN